MIINGHNMYSHDIEATVKESIQTLKDCSVVSFSIEVGGKERVVTVVEIAVALSAMDFSIIARNIQSVTSH